MRTKALLCAAFVAAGAITAMAQNVYSLNVVGYVNVTAPPGFSLLANPLSTGATNGANEIIPVADQQEFITFTGGSYQLYLYDAGIPGWVDANGNPTQPPQLPPGKGFFYSNPGATAQTITFVGQVVPNPGVTNSLPLPPGYSLVGSPMPVSGTVAAAVFTGSPPVPGAVNMPVADQTTVFPYAAGAYTYQGFDAGVPGWVDANGSPIAAPTIAIGKGFFYGNNGAGTVQWLQTLP